MSGAHVALEYSSAAALVAMEWLTKVAWSTVDAQSLQLRYGTSWTIGLADTPDIVPLEIIGHSLSRNYKKLLQVTERMQKRTNSFIFHYFYTFAIPLYLF